MCSQYNRLIEAILISTHNIPFLNMKYNTIINYPKSAAMGLFSKGPKNEFETAMVTEPSVFEPLKVHCIYQIVKETVGKSLKANNSDRIYHRSPMLTEKSKPEYKRIMPETRFNEFSALSVDPRVGISRSVSETDV